MTSLKVFFEIDSFLRGGGALYNVAKWVSRIKKTTVLNAKFALETHLTKISSKKRCNKQHVLVVLA